MATFKPGDRVSFQVVTQKGARQFGRIGPPIIGYGLVTHVSRQGNPTVQPDIELMEGGTIDFGSLKVVS